MKLTELAGMNSLRAMLGAALVVATLTAPTAGVSLASFNSTARDTAAFAAANWPNVYYLHDDGNHTADLATMSMDTVAPTGALGQYSNNCVYGALGRQIGDDTALNRSDKCHIASWITSPLPAETMTGTATLTLYTGIARFNRGAPVFDPSVGYGGTLTVEIQHLASNGTLKGSTSTTVHRDDWMQGSNIWVADSMTYTVSGYPIAQNDQIKITVYMLVFNPKNGDKGVAFMAYDAASTPSQLSMP